MSFRQGEVLDVGLKRKFEKIEIEPQVCADCRSMSIFIV